MADKTQEKIDRPPATSDMAPDPETATITRQTTIAGWKIPTDVLRAYTMVFALVAIWIYFHYSTGQIFLESRNFSNLMRQTAVTGVLAVGMLMVIITGQIDLSVGSVVGLAGGVAAVALIATSVAFAQSRRAVTAADYDRAVKMLAPALNGSTPG